MIKALDLESYPEMDKVSAIEILNELNPLTKNDDNSLVLVGSGDHKIYRDEFATPNYFMTFLKVEDTLTFISIKKIYEIIQSSIVYYTSTSPSLQGIIGLYEEVSRDSGPSGDAHFGTGDGSSFHLSL